MRVVLTTKHLRMVNDEDPLIVDGEEWEFVCLDGESEEDEHGRYQSYIFKRPSDNRFFRITVTLCRYGYKDYGYEDYMQDLNAYEVEKREIRRYEWVNVD